MDWLKPVGQMRLCTKKRMYILPWFPPRRFRHQLPPFLFINCKDEGFSFESWIPITLSNRTVNLKNKKSIACDPDDLCIFANETTVRTNENFKRKETFLPRHSADEKIIAEKGC